ncbi:hypothetical protein BZL30_7704 [Mycobacterium kansasii]|uniref:Uncharacterized protein n=1 Tax=Mycobacterium kansasii TaxID=1768 RepID=A0A1V3WMC9_MYCKA|nr:hypothetical protein BZL30_7704 [Mycobacterium kansasii]
MEPIRCFVFDKQKFMGHVITSFRAGRTVASRALCQNFTRPGRYLTCGIVTVGNSS